MEILEVKILVRKFEKCYSCHQRDSEIYISLQTKLFVTDTPSTSGSATSKCFSREVLSRSNVPAIIEEECNRMVIVQDDLTTLLDAPIDVVQDIEFTIENNAVALPGGSSRCAFEYEDIQFMKPVVCSTGPTLSVPMPSVTKNSLPAIMSPATVEADPSSLWATSTSPSTSESYSSASPTIRLQNSMLSTSSLIYTEKCLSSSPELLLSDNSNNSSSSLSNDYVPSSLGSSSVASSGVTSSKFPSLNANYAFSSLKTSTTPVFLTSITEATSAVNKEARHKISTASSREQCSNNRGKVSRLGKFTPKVVPRWDEFALRKKRKQESVHDAATNSII